MKVVKPIDMTSAVLVSTTATEACSAYNAGTTYGLGDQATLSATNKVYECIQAPSTGHAPDTSPLWWSVVGPTNAWAMFDAEISTQTEQASPLAVVLEPGACNSLTLLGLDGGSVQVDITDGVGGTSIYSATINLDGALISDWYEYFFEPARTLEEVVLTDLPAYANARATISLTGGATVKCGHCSMGTVYDLGSTEQGATAGILDFSRKDTSATGVTTLVRRGYAKRVSVRLVLSKSELSRVHRRLADLRATPCTWIGDDDIVTYSPLLAWGFYRDFSIDISGELNYCSLEIEGMT